MGVLTRLLGGRGSARATAAEVAVVRLLLGTDDERHLLLARQLEATPRVERSHPDASSIRVEPTSTVASLLFPFDHRTLMSPWAPIRDSSSGRDLEFRVVVVRGGFLRALEGRTRDGGPWPESWGVGLDDPVRRVQLNLPPAEAVAKQRKRARHDLSEWLGRPVPSVVEPFPPPSRAQLATRQTEVGGQFPVKLCEFYLIADGVEAPDLQILGFTEAYRIDNPHLPGLLLAWDADNRDEFVVVVSLDGMDEKVYRLDVHQSDPLPEPMAADFRGYLAARLPIEGSTNLSAVETN